MTICLNVPVRGRWDPSGVPKITSVPNSVNDMACVISFTALTVLISWYRTIDSLYSHGFEIDPAGPGRTALASPRAR